MKLSYVAFREAVWTAGETHKVINGRAMAELDMANRLVRVGDVCVPLENVICWRAAPVEVAVDPGPENWEGMEPVLGSKTADPAPAPPSKSVQRRLAAQKRGK